MIPGLMISQIWPKACYASGETERALERALDTGRFTVFQTVHISDLSERRNVSAMFSDSQFFLTYCITRMLAEKSLSLSSLNEGNRLKAVEEARRGINQARECGANRLSLVSGPAPEGSALRSTALTVLSESIEILAADAAEHPAVELIIEPLDYKAHKKGTLGTFTEALKIVNDLENRGLSIKICSDTSHMILNEEDPVGAVKPHLDLVAEYHLCNPVVDEKLSEFGDRHIPFGAPGVLTESDLNALIEDLFGDAPEEICPNIGLFLEVMNVQPDDSAATDKLLDYNVRIMESIFGIGL